MQALLRGQLPREPGWLFELKLDGIRVLAVKDGDRVRLFSRLPRDITADYPEIVRALHDLSARQFVTDGEIVALDERGRTSFQLLQNRKDKAAEALRYYVFDLLNFDGRSLRGLPLIRRRAVLNSLMNAPSTPIFLSATLEASAERVWTEVTKHGLEGVIAKRHDSVYEPGRRSGAWLKIKTQQEQEFVIGGYTPPDGTRKFFGAILVGYRDGKDLLFASKVGTGFDFAALRTLHHTFQKHRASACPFANLPTKVRGRFGGLTASETSRCVWLRPTLVCRVKFMEWTGDGRLRHPVFLGLRADKRAADVTREGPASSR